MVLNLVPMHRPLDSTWMGFMGFVKSLNELLGQSKILRGCEPGKVKNHWFRARYKTEKIYWKCPYKKRQEAMPVI